MGAKIQGLGVSGTPVKFAGYPKKLPSLGRGRRPLWVPGPTSPGPAGPLGNVQRRVLELSDPSETFSGAF